MNVPLLDIRNLDISFPSPSGPLAAVRDFSFSMGRERIGIVGESGSGKSMTARAVMRLLPHAARMTAERVVFMGEDLLSLPERAMRRIRGRRISMVLQDPRFSLNPVMTVGVQIEEAYRLHVPSSRREARQRTLDILEAVQIRDPERVYGLHPHQLSGGMGQRVMIAMMLIPEPNLLIADEPTSALDATVQKEVLALIDRLVSRRNMGLILISHDLELVASFCDRVLVMYAGRVVETCDGQSLAAATHPYTRALLAAAPKLGDTREFLPTLERQADWRDGPLP